MESRNWSREAAGSRYEGMNQLSQTPESVSALNAGSADDWLTGTWKTNMTWWKHIWMVDAESKMFQKGCDNVQIYFCCKVSVQFLCNFILDDVYFWPNSRCPTVDQTTCWSPHSCGFSAPCWIFLSVSVELCLFQEYWFLISPILILKSG